MCISRAHGALLLPLLLQSISVSAYPGGSNSKGYGVEPRAEKFALGSIGDSWASGVTWNLFNRYDGNKDGCMRLSHAYAVQVRDMAKEWVPGNQEVELQFKACSGSRLANMCEEPYRQGIQMDLLDRPKVVLMEAGGNNADFYPIANDCIYHQDGPKTPLYEDDPEGQGPCKSSLRNTRQRVGNGQLKDLYVHTIHRWRGHPAVVGNDASLYVLGYGRFFSDAEACNEWSFSWYAGAPYQNLTMELRKDINDLIDTVNSIIKEAVETFNDPKIVFIDVNPAFDGHRFCEYGHSRYEQYNWRDKVWIWNATPKLVVTHLDNEKKTYDIVQEEVPPAEFVEKLLEHPREYFKISDYSTTVRFSNPDSPSDGSMEWEYQLKSEIGIDTPNQDGNPGILARTLHPTFYGHKAMAEIIVHQLKKDFGVQNEQPSSPPPAAPAPPAPSTTPNPENALSIVLEYSIPPTADESTLRWIFYETPVGQSAVCREHPDDPGVESGLQPKDIANPPWPGGSFNINLFGETCEYKCNGANPGELFCPSRNGPISCWEDSGRRNEEQECGWGYSVSQRPVVTCEW